MWDAGKPGGGCQEACHREEKEPCGMPESPAGAARKHATRAEKSRVGCRKARRGCQEACHQGGKELCGMPDKFDVRVKNRRIQ